MKINTTKSLNYMTKEELVSELSIYRGINYIALLELLAKGLIWVILNWSTVKAEIDKIRRNIGA